MRPAQKRIVYMALAATLIVLFLVGMLVGYIDRKNSICRDNRPPVAESDNGLGQVLFRCHNGQTVTSND
jgi:hypothetical protein